MAKRRRHTEEFKREAVRLLMTRGERSVGDVAASLGVAENLLHAWRKRYPDTEEAVRRQRGETPEEELKRLRREVAYPGRFRDLEHARQWCDEFFRWYNAEHHHDSLALFTPQDVFMGHVERIATIRQHTLDEAYERAPERFVAGRPVVPRPPERVMLNPLDAAPPTGDVVLSADDDALSKLWPTPAASDIPIINLPGAIPSQESTANAT